MKHYNFYGLALMIALLAGCEKDGTEKRCDKGFTGKNCDQEITPSKMQVTYIRTNLLPSFDTDGSNWDVLGGKPDVYFRIFERSSGIEVYTSGIANNANPANSLSIDLSGNNILLNFPSSEYSIQAWDEDTGDDDYMGGIKFTPYHPNEKFPSSVDLACSACNTGWTLHYTYLY